MKIFLIVAISLTISLIAVLLTLGISLPTNRSKSRPAGDRYIDVLDARIRFSVEQHEGPTMLMLHGFGGDLEDFEQLSRRVGCAKSISLDLVGFGLSASPRITYDLETQRQYLIAFMDRLKIGKAVLVGTSMGASVALWTAAKCPERVLGLAVFAPSAYPGSMRHHWPGYIIYRSNIWNRTLQAVADNRIYSTLFPKSLGRQALDITASYNQAFADALPQIRQPVLLIWSKGDERVPFAYSEYYRKLLPQAQFLEAPTEIGHAAASNPSPEIVDGICRLISQVGRQ